MKKRTVAYCRVSTDDKDQINSLINQKEYFIEKINKADWVNGGLNLEKSCGDEGIYADEGITAAKLRKVRKAYQQMMEDAKQGRFDYIVTKSVSRWGRVSGKAMSDIDNLRELGIGVYFLQESIDTLDIKSDFMLNILFAQAEEESNQTSQRCKFGRKKSAENHNWPGFAPYGYDTKNKKLVVNKQESEVVKRIFEMYLEGDGTLKIMKKLNDNNISPKNYIKNKKTAGIWYQILVRNILKNPLYTGLIRLHRTESVSQKSSKKKEVLEEDWVVWQDESIRIINNDTFTKVQEQIQIRSKEYSKTRHSNKHLLSNILFCGDCGSGFSRKKIHAYERKDGTSNDLGWELMCTYRDQQGKKICKSKLRPVVKEDWMVEQIKKDILSWQDDEYAKIETADFIYYQQFKLNEEQRNELPEIEKQIEKLNKQENLLFEEHSAGVMSQEFYRKKGLSIKTSLEELNIRKKNIENLDEQRKLVDKKKNEFIKAIREVNVNELSNQLLKQIYKKIMIYRDDIFLGEESEYANPEGVLFVPMYNFGIDITKKEIDDYINNLVEQDIKSGLINFKF